MLVGVREIRQTNRQTKVERENGHRFGRCGCPIESQRERKKERKREKRERKRGSVYG